MLLLVGTAAVAAGAAPLTAGELLYNGIRLPADWPPRRNYSHAVPPEPPYITAPPSAINITLGRQLFVDSFLVDELYGAERVYHKATPHRANPVLAATEVWENGEAKPFSGGAWFYEDKFHFWYSCGGARGHPNRTTCHAVSEDGITWEKPVRAAAGGTNQVSCNWSVALTHNCCATGRLCDGPPAVCPADHKCHECHGQAFGNKSICGKACPGIPVATMGHCPSHDGNVVWIDWDEPDPARRFKMAAVLKLEGFDGLTLYHSADGDDWHVAVNKTSWCSDRSTIFQNRFRQNWVFSIKTVPPGFNRARAYWEAPSLLAPNSSQWGPMDQWTDVPGGPVPWASADDGDPYLVLPNGSVYDFYRPELYTLDGANYESVVVGLLTILQCKHADNPACPGPDEGREFNSLFPAFSRNGFHFHRPDPVRSKTGHSRSSIAPLNLTGCNSSIGCTVWNYEDSQSVGGGFLVVRDKIYLFASGNANMNWPDPTLPSDESQLKQAGLFTLRRDRGAHDRASPNFMGLTSLG
jgi:hypothetical protein